MTPLRIAALAAPVLTLLSGAALAQSLPPGPQITVQMVTQPGPGLPQFSRVDVPLLREQMPQRSGGRIQVQLASWPERNVSGPEVIRLVRSGTVEVGAVALATVAGDVRLLDVVDLPGLNPTLVQARRISSAVVPEANRQLERFGVRIVAMYPFPAQVFFCREPVSSLADLRGKRVRTGGGATNDFVQAIGAQPVGIGFPEVYAALERGVVDCAITGTGSGNGARWYEVTRGLYTLPVSWSIGMYIVNLNWWNRLDPAVRTFMETSFAELEDAQWRMGEESTEDGIACNIGQRDGCRLGRVVETRPMTLARATQGDLETLRTTLTSAILPAFVTRCGAECGTFYNNIVAPISGVRFEQR